MKFTKHILTLVFAGMLSTFAFAEGPDSVERGPFVSDVVELLEKSNINFERYNNSFVLIDLMVTDDGRIIVVRTDDRNMDSSIKGALNYKEVETDSLLTNHVYTLPVLFKFQK